MKVYIAHKGDSVQKSTILAICTSIKSAVFICAKYAADNHSPMMDWEMNKLEHEKRASDFFIVTREADACFY